MYVQYEGNHSKETEPKKTFDECQALFILVEGPM